MLTYYAAQLGISLSVVNSYENHEVNHRVIQHQDLIKGVKSIYNYVKSIYFDDNLELINLDESSSQMKLAHTLNKEGASNASSASGNKESFDKKLN